MNTRVALSREQRLALPRRVSDKNGSYLGTIQKLGPSSWRAVSDGVELGEFWLARDAVAAVYEANGLLAPFGKRA